MRLLSAVKMITAAKVNGPCGCTLTVGDPVIVDGFQGRGVIVARKGRRLAIRFRDGEYVSRDQRYVHKIKSDYVSQYSSVRENNLALNAGKVIRQSPAEFRKSERRAGIKPYVKAGGPGSGRHKEYYHATSVNNVNSIKQKGILPVSFKNKVFVFSDASAAVNFARSFANTGDKGAVLKLNLPYSITSKLRHDNVGDDSGAAFSYKGMIPARYISKVQHLRASIEQEGGPLRKPTDSYIVKQGALFCVKSRNVNDQNFGCFNSREEAEEHLRFVQ